MRLRNLLITLLAAVATTGCWATGQPQLTGARLVERSAKTGVQAAIQEIIKADKGPAWIAYSAPVIPGERHMCCYSSARITGNSACCGSCRGRPPSCGVRLPFGLAALAEAMASMSCLH